MNSNNLILSASSERTQREPFKVLVSSSDFTKALKIDNRGQHLCICVRYITNYEGNLLKRILRRSNDVFKAKRARAWLP